MSQRRRIPATTPAANASPEPEGSTQSNAAGFRPPTLPAQGGDCARGAAGDDDRLRAVAEERLDLLFRIGAARQTLRLVVIRQEIVDARQQAAQLLHPRLSLSEDDVDDGDNSALAAVGKQIGQFVAADAGHGEQPAEVKHLQTIDPIASNPSDLKSGVGSEGMEVAAIFPFDQQDHGLAGGVRWKPLDLVAADSRGA